MRNVHTPERREGESQAAYRERRQASRDLVRMATRGPEQPAFVQTPGVPGPNWMHWWLGQHTTTVQRQERRDLVAGHGRRQFLKRLKALRRAHAGVREMTGTAS